MERLRKKRKEINYADFRTETEGPSAGYTRQAYETRSISLWAKSRGELDPSLTAHDRESGAATDVADSC